VAGVPLTVYGRGKQVRGYLNLKDTLQCVSLAVEKPADSGQLRIFNQFTELFSVNELAERVQHAGKRMNLDVQVRSIPNPRKEKEEHYYNPVHSGLLELGLEPHFMTDDVLADMLAQVVRYRDRIDIGRILPRVSWNVSAGHPRAEAVLCSLPKTSATAEAPAHEQAAVAAESR
jgi:UDP-sulfoquinovose synthase